MQRKNAVVHIHEDDDETPLLELKKINQLSKRNGALKKHTVGKEINEDDVELEQKPKSKRGRKPTNLIKEDIKTENGDGDDAEVENTLKKKRRLKIPKETKEKEKSSYNLEKGRELDVFISEWKPHLECDLCSETALNFEKLRVHFRTCGTACGKVRRQLMDRPDSEIIQ